MWVFQIPVDPAVSGVKAAESTADPWGGANEMEDKLPGLAKHSELPVRNLDFVELF
jgi:hypothetical protein